MLISALGQHLPQSNQPQYAAITLSFRERSVTARVISATKVIKLADLSTLAFLFGLFLIQ